MKILPEMYLSTGKNRLNVGCHPRLYKDPGIFLLCEICDLAHISGKTDRIFVEILSLYHFWTKKFPLNFGSRTGSELRILTADPDGFALAEVYTLHSPECSLLKCNNFNRTFSSSSLSSAVLQEDWQWAEHYANGVCLRLFVQLHQSLARSVPWYLQPFFFFVFWQVFFHCSSTAKLSFLLTYHSNPFCVSLSFATVVSPQF